MTAAELIVQPESGAPGPGFLLHDQLLHGFVPRYAFRWPTPAPQADWSGAPAPATSSTPFSRSSPCRVTQVLTSDPAGPRHLLGHRGIPVTAVPV